MRIDNKKLLRELIGSKLKNRILEFLLGDNSPVSERQMAQILDVSHTAVNKAMKDLLEYNIVKATTIGSSLVWRVNEKSAAYWLVKQYIDTQNKSSFDIVVSNLKMELANIKNVCDLHLFYTSKKTEKKQLSEINFEVYIIGSTINGTANLDSDVDCIIICPIEAKNIIEGNMSKHLSNLRARFLELFGNDISIHIFTQEEIEKRPELHWVKEAIKKGIKVYP